MVAARSHSLSARNMLDAVLLILFGLVLRAGWHMLAAPRDWPDTAVYLSAGRSLLKTGLMNTDVYMPLYPLMLVGFGYDGVLWLQVALSALTIGCVYALSLELFASRQAAILAGLLTGLYPLLIFYANMRLTETSYIFLTIGAVWLLYRGSFVLGSAALVLSILLRPSVDLVAPLLIVAACIARGEHTLPVVVRRVALYLVVYVVLMTPWWWHNWHLYGAFVRLNLGDATTLIVENNPYFDRFGLDFNAIAPAWQEFDRIADPLARHKAKTDAALAYILSDPLHWLWRCVDRFFRFYSPVPGSDSFAVNALALLATLPVLLGAFVQLFRLRLKDWLRLAPVLLMIAFLTAIHTAIHGLPRYRLPIDPFLIILAAKFYSDVLSWGLRQFQTGKIQAA